MSRNWIDDPPGWKWGDLIPGFGHSRCFRCHRPWWLTHPHDVSYTGTGTSAFFVMCHPCWSVSPLGLRLEAAEWLARQWADGQEPGSDRGFEVLWPKMRTGVERDSSI